MSNSSLLYRHYKSGDLYRKICDAKLEATDEPMTVYVNVITGQTWTRPTVEFESTVLHHEQEQPRFLQVTGTDVT